MSDGTARRAGLALSLLAFISMSSAVACTPRTEKPADTPGTVPAIAPTEKRAGACGYNPGDNCGKHHNNNGGGNRGGGNHGGGGGGGGRGGNP